MKVIRKIIEINDEKCDGCGNCVPACAEGAIRIVDGKARVLADKYCDGLGACLGDCPQGALRMVEREADEFDEEAVHEMLKQQGSAKKPEGCTCPSAAVKSFPMAAQGLSGKKGKPASGGPSCLGHWPVQIRLVPAGAPFLKGADLIIAADCVPVAYPSFHKDFLDGRAVMIGCPKFDDAQGTIEKLSQIFNGSGINSITCVTMEVPCCSGLPMIIQKALDKAGMDIPLEETVISSQGEILS